MRKRKLAVLNLRIESDSYNFPVMLGPSVISGEVVIADPRRTSVPYCAVTLSDERMVSRLGLLERRIEIKSDNRAVIEACPEQLVLALRLYRPTLFWLSPWINRTVWRDVKPVGSEYSLHGYGFLEREYSLDSNGLKSFSRFAERLAPFHFNRNLYHLLRQDPIAVRMYEDFSGFLPTADPSAKILPEEDPEGRRFVMAYGHIMVAVDFFQKAGAEARRSEDLRLLFLMIAAEALVGDNMHREGARERIAQRLSVLEEPTKTREPTAELIRRLYSLRNALLHGSAADSRWRSKKGDMILNYGFLRPQLRDVDKFADLVRWCLLHALSYSGRHNWSGGPGKMEMIKRLDRAATNASEARRIRKDVVAFSELDVRA